MSGLLLSTEYRKSPGDKERELFSPTILIISLRESFIAFVYGEVTRLSLRDWPYQSKQSQKWDCFTLFAMTNVKSYILLKSLSQTRFFNRVLFIFLSARFHTGARCRE